MQDLTASVKTLVASTIILKHFSTKNDELELLLGQSCRTVKTNNFYVYQNIDLSKLNPSKRVPLYLKAALYGKNEKKVHFTINENLRLCDTFVTEVEKFLLQHHQN
jgi:hypothetical protein